MSADLHRPARLRALRPDGCGLTVVGDDAQAIYSFRAATVDNILNFPDQFEPRAEVITLAQNYRSNQQVLDASNALMADAPRQFRKHLLAVLCVVGWRDFWLTMVNRAVPGGAPEVALPIGLMR